MFKSIASVLLVVVALLPAFTGSAFSPVSTADNGAGPDAVEAARYRRFLPLAARKTSTSPRPPGTDGCPLGVWISPEAVPVLQQYGSYTHTNKMDQAATYFPRLAGSGTLRTLRCVSLQQMHDFAAEAARRGIPYDAFTYDLEGWDQTPEWERENQVEATRMARDIAHGYGKILIMGPARAFTWRNWPKMAPYADMWVIQAQGGQRSYAANQQFYNWLKGYVDMLRPYNPGMPIWAQLSTSPDSPLTTNQYMDYVHLVWPSLVDGVYVFNPADLPLLPIWQHCCAP